MRVLLLAFLYLFPPFVFAQSNTNKGEIAIKWDPIRLVNPFNSTIQVGAEYGITDNLSIHSDIGINSNLFNSTYYNKGILIIHNQLRKYKRHGHFYGLDLFYMHAKDYSNFKCMYDKNKKFNADYDSVTLIKNAPGIAIISGRQLMLGDWIIDLYFGAGLRIVNNQVRYQTRIIHIGACAQTHFSWHNDKYSGTFIGGHFSCGLKFGYIINRK